MDTLRFIVVFVLTLMTLDLNQVRGDCKQRRMDIAILGDRSRSLNNEHLRILRRAIRTIVEKVGVSPSGSHFGIITFGPGAAVYNTFKEEKYYNKNNLIALVNDKYSKIAKEWGTRIDKGQHLAITKLFVPLGGDRPDAKNLMFIFTDGRPTGQNAKDFMSFGTLTRILERKGVTIVAVGVGKNVQRGNLRKIAGSKGKVFMIKNFNLLVSELEGVLDSACAIDGGYCDWSVSSECSVTCGGGQRTLSRTCTNPPPSNGGNNCDALGPAQMTEECNAQECPIDGGYGDWSVSSECSVTCGGGQRTLSRTCTNPPPSNGGNNCDALGPAQMTEECNTQECPPSCKGGLDIGLVIDKSKSVKIPNLRKMIEFLVNLVDKFHPAPDGDHFGFITFHNKANLVFDFADETYHDKEALLNKIKSEEIKLELQTRTDLALMMARDDLFSAKGGDRPDKPSIMLVFTDGKPTNPSKSFDFEEFAENISNDFKKNGVTTVAIGIGGRLNKVILQQIAGKDNPVIQVQDFSQLEGMLATIKSSACSSE